MGKNKSEFFIWPYVRDFFALPKIPMNKTLYKSSLFGKMVEVPIIGIMWLLSKIHPRMEQIVALKLSKKWSFKPIPNFSTLSESAVQFKQERNIEINTEMNAQTKILDIATFNDIVETYPFSEVGLCGCRSVIMHCDSPTRTCLIMRWPQDVSKKIPDYSKFQRITKEELEEVVELADKYSLVHMTLNYPDPNHTYVVCNCCDCCCVSFREFVANAVPLIHASKYEAKIDSNKCKGCFHCINFRCRFRAIQKVNEDGTIIDPKKEDRELLKRKWPSWSERRNGWGNRIRKDSPSWKKIKEKHSGKWYAKVDPNRCFGCGNCASPKYGCPEGAIKLYPRE